MARFKTTFRPLTKPKSFGLAIFTLLAVLVAGAIAQDNPDEKEKVLPAPEIVALLTSDKVQLRAVWYAGTNAKNTVPVILLHGWGGKRADLEPLAEFLQADFGHAVIVPDLRGHGESLRIESVDQSINRERFKKAEIASMVNDIEACKKFLVPKNNSGELNINLLTLVAAEESCVHAIAWSIDDWKWPPIAGIQQGQDVKAVVMISPRQSFNGLSMTQGLKAPVFSGKGTKPLSMLLVWGSQDQESDRDGKAIYNALKKNRPEVVDSAAGEDAKSDADRNDAGWKKRDLFRVSYQVGKSGADLLTDPSVAEKLKSHIAVFIDKKIVANVDDLRWQSRQRK